MSTGARENLTYQFGPFRLDPLERLLLRDKQVVPLTPKAFDLLVYLVEHHGRLVEKAALMSALWPDAVVEEANLAFNISALRKVLDDGGDAASLIQTVPTRGYRFVAAVSVAPRAPVDPETREPEPADPGAVAVSLVAWSARRNTAAAVCAVALVIAVFTVWMLKSYPLPPPKPVAKGAITLPADAELVTTFPVMAMSPDGAHLVYVSRRGAVQQLYLRSLDSLTSTTLSGTEGAVAPFFSPDSQWVGFFAERKLKKIRVTGGTSQIVCDAPGAYGGSWATNDVIYFAPGSFSGLWRVAASGGAPQPFTKLRAGEISHRSPQVLPGERAVLFTSRSGPGSDERQVQVQRVSSGERLVLAQGDTGYYVPTGHLVYVHSATRTLMAVAFDVETLKVDTAWPVAVAEGLFPAAEGAHYTFSGNGLLAYLAGGSAFNARTLVWVDQGGRTESLFAPDRQCELPRISPAGDQVAFVTPGAKMDLWIYNLARGSATKLISEGSIQFPIWTRDGKRVTYRATRAGTRNIFWRMADGSGTEERLTTGKGNHAPLSWSPDGKVLLLVDATEGEDIVALNVADRTTQPFVRSQSSDGGAQFSPDGRWVAYVSDESGGEEVYVKPYLGDGGKWQISTDGGKEPVWNPNGRELYYRSGNKMMAVDVATRPGFTAGRSRLLFAGDFVPSPSWMPNYDVSHDGRRFLMVQPSAHENATPTQIIVVFNWFEELERLAPHRGR